VSFRAVDPDLPIHPLSPNREKFAGYVEGAREKGLEKVQKKAQQVAMATAVRAVEGSDE
jgi:hypothetical protein